MIELLAPAGNLDILKSAVDCGADAVYCGLNSFNARIKANNFDIDSFREGARYCHLRGSKIYLTLNTLISDFEFDECISTAVEAYENGCDGILIQDVGLAYELHKKYPDIPLHCSTQMNIFSDGDFKKLSSMGFERVVLPRELSLAEIAKRSKIAARYNIETEVFAHGAVCVCYSGLCLFSAMNRSGSRSGNRGLCAQPCREEYTLSSDNGIIRSGHLLSPKDRDVTSYISDLIESGVSSLKLEGRMRDSNYVKSAVFSYRRLIDAYYEGTLDNDLVKSIQNDLLINFNRGGSYTTQFLTGKKENNFLSGEFPGKFGLLVGKLQRVDSKKGTITFSFAKNIPVPDKGDYISIRQDNKEVCSFPIGKIHEAPDQLTVKGLHPEMIKKLSIGSGVYLMGHKTSVDSKLLRKTHITLSVDVSSLTIMCNASVNGGINNNTFADYEVDLLVDYEGSALSSERIISQLSKTGDTPFVVDEVYFTGDDSIKCPVSLINELRRGVCESLESEIDYLYERALVADFIAPAFKDPSSAQGTKTIMYTYPCVKDDFSMVSMGADIYAFSVFELGIKQVRQNIIKFMKTTDAKLCMILPDLYHDRTEELIHSVASTLKEELGDSFAMYMDSRVHESNTKLKDMGLLHFISGGANIYNSRSFEYASNNCEAISLSYELSEGEIISLIDSSSSSCDIIVHSEGMIPWMQSDFCPVGGNKTKCGSCFEKGNFEMKSHNMDSSVRIVPHSFDCSSTIYGEPKYTVSDDYCDKLTDKGVNIIVNKVVL